MPGVLSVKRFELTLLRQQFEWAWQKPHLSRNLRVESESEITPQAALLQATSSSDLLPPVFPANQSRGWLETKIAVARTMLTRKPYSRLPLHVRIFTENTWQMWQQCEPDVPGQQEREAEEVTGKKRKGGKPKEKAVKGIKRYGPFRPLPSTIDVTFDRGGVDGKAAVAADAGEGASSSRPVPIDVNDTAFRTAHWQKWQRVSGRDRPDADDVQAGRAVPKLDCVICKEALDAQVSFIDAHSRTLADPVRRTIQHLPSALPITSQMNAARPTTYPVSPPTFYATHPQSLAHCYRKAAHVPPARHRWNGGKSFADATPVARANLDRWSTPEKRRKRRRRNSKRKNGDG